MRRPAILLLAGVLGACATTGSQDVPRETLTTVGIIEYGEAQEGEFRFGLSRIEQQFVVETAEVPDMDALHAALLSSNETGRAIRVTFDVESGAFAPDSTQPSYAVLGVEYDGANIAGMSRSRSGTRRATPAETALARGVAYYSSNSADRAVPHLDRALSDRNLRPALRALALNTRGNVLLDTAWDTAEVPTEAVDRQLVRALDDFRQWAAIEPENLEPRIAVGLALRDLGAYEEAIDIFGELIPGWPEQRIRLVTRIGATYRMMGDYERALGVLDELVARDGPQPGMMFHYHRGWTLNLLGRYEEAIREFNEGFESQPDYSGAFGRRACSHARLGQLEEALADQRRANELYESFFAGVRSTPAIVHDRAWAQSVVASLEAAIASGSKAPNSAPCEGQWNYGEKPRERSRLLPDAHAGNSPAINAI